MEVRYLAPSDLVAATANASNVSLYSVPEQVTSKGFTETIWGFLAAILRVPISKLNFKDKQEFNQYWYGHKTSYKKTQ
jgi:hypothetical protein